MFNYKFGDGFFQLPFYQGNCCAAGDPIYNNVFGLCVNIFKVFVVVHTHTKKTKSHSSLCPFVCRIQLSTNQLTKESALNSRAQLQTIPSGDEDPYGAGASGPSRSGVLPGQPDMEKRMGAPAIPPNAGGGGGGRGGGYPPRGGPPIRPGGGAYGPTSGGSPYHEPSGGQQMPRAFNKTFDPTNINCNSGKPHTQLYRLFF